MKILTIIPARIGSKRVPQKNLAMLGEWPLFVWSIRAAWDAGLTDGDFIIVSTDSPLIADITEQYTCRVHDRGERLAGDYVPMISVVRDIWADVSEDFDAILLLQPTSPFRTGADIKAAIDIMKVNGAESVISVTDAPSDLVFEIGHAGRLRHVIARDPLVVPNGAIFLIRTELVFTSTWWDCVAYAYRMPKERSLDIDTMADLELARDIVAKGTT